MTGETFFLTASDGAKIAVHHWLPEAEPAVVILVCHGMAEYGMRYDRFAEAAAARGYAVYVPDLRGHGETAGSLSKLGYLSDGDGFSRVMEDIHELALEIKTRFPGKHIVLMGHSFGSFIAQLFMETHGNLVSGCVLAGTRGPDRLALTYGSLAANLAVFFYGRKKASPFLRQLFIGSNNRRIKDPESPNSWLTRDIEELDSYDASPWAGFTCTGGFYQDLAHGLLVIHRKEKISLIPHNLPVFLVCGSEDPTGKYGKTVRKLADIYTCTGLSDVALKIYKGARHELLHETNRDEVTADILDWISGCR